MKKGLTAGIVVTIIALFVTGALAFGPGYGMGTGGGYGTCRTSASTVTPEESQKFAKFQSDILPLKQKMLQIRTELLSLRAQTPTDWKAVSVKEKEMVDIRTAIQQKAAESGFPAMGCGGCGNGPGHGHRMAGF